ncbi:opossum [Anaeramoeba flamelloides]|uniref:Opossum n=1 Tax=Anaeramoeba flamelloides TaxID=1746091 RepID=A0ABQ8XJN7_9EUKA|nr:opossum [Anaeramoeba flamelloides]
MNLRKICLLFLFCLFLVLKVKAITFTIEPHKSVCFYQTLETESKAHADYQVLKGGKLDISFQIKDPNGNNIYNLKQLKAGSYNFIVDIMGDYSFCFDNGFSSISKKEVNFNFQAFSIGRFRRRVHDDMYENEYEATTPEELNQLAQTLETLSDNIGEVRELQMYIKGREIIHRNTTESTNSRVLWWSLFATFLIIAGSVLQITYLKNIFLKKSNV